MNDAESGDNASTLSTCPCQHCEGLIQFDPSWLESSETSAVVCPHCQCETRLFLPHPAAVNPPPITGATETPVWFGPEEAVLNIVLSSGASHVVKQIQLFNEDILRVLTEGKAQAAELLGGSQSPFGYMGDAFWVTANMLLAQYVSRKISEKMATKAVPLLKTLVERERQLRKTQNFFPVGRIENIDYPIPSLWRAIGPNGGFVHSGDDYVAIQDKDSRVTFIRWKAVESFKYVPTIYDS